MWLAMYFGMLCIGCQTASLEMRYSALEPVTGSHESVRLYRTLCAKALTIAGQYAFLNHLIEIIDLTYFLG
jgi:hypothetical protein